MALPESELERVAKAWLRWVTDERAELFLPRICDQLSTSLRFRLMARGAWNLPDVLQDAIAAAPPDPIIP